MQNWNQGEKLLMIEKWTCHTWVSTGIAWCWSKENNAIHAATLGPMPGNVHNARTASSSDCFRNDNNHCSPPSTFCLSISVVPTIYFALKTNEHTRNSHKFKSQDLKKTRTCCKVSILWSFTPKNLQKTHYVKLKRYMWKWGIYFAVTKNFGHYDFVKTYDTGR
jgi:hypothetical protein